MVSSEEKQRFMESLFGLVENPINLLGIQQRIHALLMKDTGNGKLYKYRCFDKEGHALSNLRDGTLHCSNPNSFNDPFDCKIGVTFQSLYLTKYGVELDCICSTLEKFIMIINNQTTLEECTNEEQRIISKLLSQDELMGLITYHRSKNHTPEELAIVLKENVLLILGLMQPFLEDEKFSPSLGILASILPHMLAKMTTEGILKLSEDKVTIQEYVETNGIANDVDEIDATISLSKNLNPELAKATDNVEKFINDMEYKIGISSAELFKIGCLCTDYKNRLMWSHYADGHKGFCVEYDFSNCDDETLNDLPLPVIYTTNRPLIPWKAAFEKTPQNMQEASNEIILALLTKDNAWKYENEWHVFINANEPADHKMPRVSCIYLGALISDKNRDNILKIAKEKNIPVKQMKVDRGQYDLHSVEVEL